METMKIKWKKESRLDYFGKEKIVKKGEIGKAIAKSDYEGQYLVQFQDMNPMYALEKFQFEFVK